jgi:hypothetical protein
LLTHEAEIEQPRACADAERIDRVLCRQDEHHEDEAGAEQGRASGNEESLSRFDDLF